MRMRINPLSFVSILLLILIWQIVGTHLQMLPTPGEVLEVFIKLVMVGEPVLGRTLQEHLFASIIKVTIGSLAAFAVAVPLGLLMGWSKHIYSLISPIVEILRPIPPPAWIPLGFILFMSFKNTTLIVQFIIVFLAAFFPTVINTVHGVKSIERINVDVAKNLGASSYQMLTKVIFQGALPSVVTGLRIGLGTGWMVLIVVEMIGGVATGIGFFIWSMYMIGGKTAEIICGIIMIGATSYIMNEGFLFLERRINRWR